MRKYIKARLKERSTRLGLSALLGVFGFVVTPEQIDVIAPLIVGAIGLIESVMPD